jgi:hypothetical protein
MSLAYPSGEEGGFYVFYLLARRLEEGRGESAPSGAAAQFDVEGSVGRPAITVVRKVGDNDLAMDPRYETWQSSGSGSYPERMGPKIVQNLVSFRFCSHNFHKTDNNLLFEQIKKIELQRILVC